MAEDDGSNAGLQTAFQLGNSGAAFPSTVQPPAVTAAAPNSGSVAFPPITGVPERPLTPISPLMPGQGNSPLLAATQVAPNSLVGGVAAKGSPNQVGITPTGYSTSSGSSLG
jgi:hypothetical protein